jgi:hypothetical protein
MPPAHLTAVFALCLPLQGRQDYHLLAVQLALELLSLLLGIGLRGHWLHSLGL